MSLCGMKYRLLAASIQLELCKVCFSLFTFGVHDLLKKSIKPHNTIEEMLTRMKGKRYGYLALGGLVWNFKLLMEIHLFYQWCPGGNQNEMAKFGKPRRFSRNYVKRCEVCGVT